MYSQASARPLASYMQRSFGVRLWSTSEEVSEVVGHVLSHPMITVKSPIYYDEYDLEIINPSIKTKETCIIQPIFSS